MRQTDFCLNLNKLSRIFCCSVIFPGKAPKNSWNFWILKDFFYHWNENCPKIRQIEGASVLMVCLYVNKLSRILFLLFKFRSTYDTFYIGIFPGILGDLFCSESVWIKSRASHLEYVWSISHKLRILSYIKAVMQSFGSPPLVWEASLSFYWSFQLLVVYIRLSLHSMIYS